MEAWEILDLLTSLSDKSLVVYQESEGAARRGSALPQREQARKRQRRKERRSKRREAENGGGAEQKRRECSERGRHAGHQAPPGSGPSSGMGVNFSTCTV